MMLGHWPGDNCRVCSCYDFRRVGDLLPLPELQCYKLQGWYVHEFLLRVGPLFLELNESMELASCIDMAIGYGSWL